MPIQCEYCKKYFCENHYTLDGHQCASVPQFDLSQQEKDEINSRVFQRAMNAIQRSRERSEKLDSSTASTPSEFQRAGAGASSDAAPQGAQQQRKKASEILREAREKEGKEYNSSSRGIVASTGSSTSEKPRSEAARLRKQKVAIMKIKAKAPAPKQVSETDRVYFLLDLDESTGFKRTHSIPGYDPKMGQVNICLSRTWQIGKVIDYISETTGVQNLNNSTMDEVSRLIVYTPFDWPKSTVRSSQPYICSPSSCG